MSHRNDILLTPVGRVQADDENGRCRLVIDEPYRPALRELGSCTHAIVVWWTDRARRGAGRGPDRFPRATRQPSPRRALTRR